MSTTAKKFDMDDTVIVRLKQQNRQLSGVAERLRDIEEAIKCGCTSDEPKEAKGDNGGRE